VSGVRVTADTGRCVGSAQCSRLEPLLFDQDDGDGTVVLLHTAPPAHLHEAARAAADICPVRAITVTTSEMWLDRASNRPGHHSLSDSRVPTVREGTAP